MNETERRVRLIRWLEIIFDDVQDLLLDDHIFWELQKVVQENPQFTESSGLLTQWMASAFVQATAVGVRRQAKASDESISLCRFLKEVQTYPRLVSREHSMSFYAGKEVWLVEFGQRDFNCLAGEGRERIPPAVVDEHLHELAQAVGAIEHDVDRRIAHHDKRGIGRPMPMFTDLTMSLKALYWQFLKGPSMTTMLPPIQFDWQDVFRWSNQGLQADGGTAVLYGSLAPSELGGGSAPAAAA